MKLQLLGPRVLIEPVIEEMEGGFLIPESARTFRVGHVVAIGTGTRFKNGERHQIPLMIGDKVVLSDDYRMPIEIDGKNYFLVSTEKVMAILP